jgi:hypothetical protein
MSDFVIEDGYSEEAFIAPEPGLHGPLTFTFRPLLAHRRDAVSRNEGEAFANAAAKEMAKQIKSWSATGADGKALAVSESHIKSAKPRLFDKLWLIVAGYKGSDAKEAPTDLEGDAKN